MFLSKKEIAYGGVVINNDGEILLRETKNHFDGYVWTFAKGRSESGESPEKTAIREVQEEMGVGTKIICDIPGEFTGGTTINKYFLMRFTGDKGRFSDETEKVEWVKIEQAKKLIEKTTNQVGRKRDLAVLDSALRIIEKLNQEQIHVDLGEYKILEKSIKNTAPRGKLVNADPYPRKYKGSTNSLWVKDKDNNLWFLKPDPIYSELTTSNEMICSIIYDRLGYRVPEIALISFGNKRYAATKNVKNKGYANVSDLITDKTFRRLRVFAAYLKDWDRIHEETNTLNTGFGKYTLIDFGGCLGGRAMGDHKPGRVYSKEIGVFEADATIEQIYSDFKIIMRATLKSHPPFEAITSSDIDKSLRLLNKLTNSHIRKAVDSAHYSSSGNSKYMESALIKRRDTLLKNLKDYHTFNR